MFFTKIQPQQMAKAELQDEERFLMGDLSRMELARSNAAHFGVQIKRLKAYVAANDTEDRKPPSLFAPNDALGVAKRELKQAQLAALRYTSEAEKNECMVDYRQRKIRRLRLYLSGTSLDDLPLSEAQVVHFIGKMA